MKCGYCGKNIKDDAKFCNYCGHNLREIPSDEQPAPPSKGGYLSTLLTLLAIIAILCVGGAYLLKNGGSSGTVSSSDVSASSLPANQTNQANHSEVTHIDQTLIGQWRCLDPTAVGYSRSAYGIDVDIVLNIPDSSGFTLRYAVTDTGAPALNLKLSGTYAVKNGAITFRPDLTNATGDTGSNFFKNLSADTSFEYTVNQDTLTLKSETGADIVFNRVSA